jgi:two-component sensor histidine kinase
MSDSGTREISSAAVPLLEQSDAPRLITPERAAHGSIAARQWAILAIGFVIITLARIALSSALHDRVAYSVYFVAVALGAWLGGWRMGLMATALAAFLTKFLPLPTGHEVSLARPGDLAAFILFFCVSGCIVASLEALQRSKAASERHAAAADQHSQSLECEIARRVEAERELRQKSEEQYRHVDQIEALNMRLRRAMAETHHRVKNNLQVVSALVDIQALTYEEAVPRDELVRVGQHIRSLAAIHDLLTERAGQGADTGRIRAGAVIDKLSPLLQSIVSDRTIKFEVEDVEIEVRQGTSLAVLINELVSNALKHGQGDIEVKLACCDDLVSLTVTDYGPGFGPDFDPARNRSTGLELIESVGRHDLMGTVMYSNGPEGGAVVVVEFPRVG